MTKGQERFICKNVDTFRSVFLAFLVPFFGGIAYLFVNFDELSSIKIMLVIGGLILCVIVLVLCFLGYNHYMKQVREMK